MGLAFKPHQLYFIMCGLLLPIFKYENYYIVICNIGMLCFEDGGYRLGGSQQRNYGILIQFRYIINQMLLHTIAII